MGAAGTCVRGSAGQPAARETTLLVPGAVPVIGAQVGAGSITPGSLPWAKAGFGWRGQGAQGAAQSQPAPAAVMHCSHSDEIANPWLCPTASLAQHKHSPPTRATLPGSTLMQRAQHLSPWPHAVSLQQLTPQLTPTGLPRLSVREAVLCVWEHGPPPAPIPRPAPAAPQLPVPAVGSRQARTSRRRQHFSAPGQLWSDKQYLLVGRVGLLPIAGHTPALLGAGRAAGGRWPLCARRGGGLAAGPSPRSPRCCWAGAGGRGRARSSSARAQVLGIVLLGLLWH